MSLEGSSTLWACHLVLMVVIHSSEEHRLKPSLRITADNNNGVRKIACDTGMLTTDGRDPILQIIFTIDTLCGIIQGTAEDIVKQYTATFSTIDPTQRTISTLLVNMPLSTFLSGSNISCQVRQKEHLEVHQSTKISLCELHTPPSTVHKLCNEVEGFARSGTTECQENTTECNNTTTKVTTDFPTTPTPTSVNVTQMSTTDGTDMDTHCSGNPNCRDATLTAMFAPIEVSLVLLVLTVLAAITGVLCYKKRRSLHHNSSTRLSSEFVHEVHQPVMTTFPVQLEQSLSSSFSPLEVTSLRCSSSSSREAGRTQGTPCSISLQSRNSERVEYV